MVEGSNIIKNKFNIDFKKLKPAELSEKIALLVKKKSRVIFWKSSPRFYEGSASHIEVGLIPILTISNAVAPIKLNDEKVCLNFSVDDLEYFFSGKVIEHDDEKRIIRFEISDKCFCLEKRFKERLQTFPKYEAYAYLKYFIDGPKNVILFNKSEQKNKDFLSNLNDARLLKMVSLSDDLLPSEEEDVVGFRVEDLSSSGLCFFASEAEKENILKKYESSNFKLVLSFEMQIFTLEDTKIIYMVDYINPQFAGSTMFKVGLTFKDSISLKRKIEDVSGISSNLVDYQNEFEEFIRND